MEKQRQLDRRSVLHGSGIALVAGIAGCTSSSDGDGDGGDGSGDGMNDGNGMDDGDGMDDSGLGEPTDPAEAPMAAIDRFSEAAGTLHVRSDNDNLPGPDEPIDFDAMFLAQGLGPQGDVVQYYDFDVQPTAPAPIYALFYENGDPVADQLNIIDVVPGDDGYNDFWQVNKVTVPDSYEANQATSVEDIVNAGFDVETTDIIKNCPVVPAGSTAEKRGGDAPTGSVSGWYEGEVVEYFLFEEASLSTTGSGEVPRSPIYVSFNTNPGQEGGGPPSGFMTEPGTDQTHNVLGSLPADSTYSPLWMVNIYDNADFDSVTDLASATNANILAEGAANVNCPVVTVGGME